VVVGSALGLAGVLAATLVGLAWLNAAWSVRPAPVPGSPPIWAQERAVKQRYLADGARQLGRYRWIDRKAGVVQLPIDRAMALVARRGIQWRTEPTP
jgi:hypothetical protein